MSVDVWLEQQRLRAAATDLGSHCGSNRTGRLGHTIKALSCVGPPVWERVEEIAQYQCPDLTVEMKVGELFTMARVLGTYASHEIMA
jgi:hypothetical protein